MIASDELVTTANRALEALSGVIIADNWQQVLTGSLSGTALDTNIKAVDDKLHEIGVEEPVGAVEGGTGMIRDMLADIDGEHAQEAIKLLKFHNRLHQCGRGRGRCLVLLDNTPLASGVEAAGGLIPERIRTVDRLEVAEEPVEVEAEQSEDGRVDPRDVNTMTRLLREHFHDAQQRIRELARMNENAHTRISELQSQLAERDAKIAELERNRALADMTSW